MRVCSAWQMDEHAIILGTFLDIEAGFQIVVQGQAFPNVGDRHVISAYMAAPPEGLAIMITSSSRLREKEMATVPPSGRGSIPW